MTIPAKTRDYLFDNYKTLLIFLVVVGHFIDPSAKSNPVLLIIKWCIVSFHMPAFIFISGYFSKKNLPLHKLIQRFAIPYLIYEIIYYLWYALFLHKPTGLYLLKPKFTLWYLLALFFWRLVTPYVKKIPHYMTFTVIAGFLIGFSNMDNNFLTLPRILAFYPFYLAGNRFTPEHVQKFRTRQARSVAAFCIGMIFLFLAFLAFNQITTAYIFYGRYNYISMKQGIAEGLFWRFTAYFIGFVMFFAVLAFIPEKKLPISYIGTRTMAIYFFHGLTYKYLEYSQTILNDIHGVWGTTLLLLGCVGITLLFSCKPFSSFTNLVSNIPVPSFNHTTNKESS